MFHVLFSVFCARIFLRLTLLLGQRAYNAACTVVLDNIFCYHGFMKADLRISVKDYHRNKNLKILLLATPFAPRRFFVRMNGERWPKDGGPVSLTRLLSALRKSLVRSV